MIKSIIKVGLMLAVGIIGYNFFLGTPEEKASSRETIGAVANATKAAGKAVGGVFKGEYKKFRDGKYDNAIEKIGGALDKGKEKLKGGTELLGKIDDWTDRQSEWRKTKRALKQQLKDAGDDANASEEIQKAIKKHNEEAEQLEAEGKKLQKAAEDAEE